MREDGMHQGGMQDDVWSSYKPRIKSSSESLSYMNCVGLGGGIKNWVRIYKRTYINNSVYWLDIRDRKGEVEVTGKQEDICP